MSHRDVNLQMHNSARMATLSMHTKGTFKLRSLDEVLTNAKTVLN